jgi:hypothetical protein
MLLKAGVPIQHVQRILRHANVRTTVDTYGHLANEDLRAPLELVVCQNSIETGRWVSSVRAVEGSPSYSLCARRAEPALALRHNSVSVRRGSKARNSGASESEFRDKIWTRSHADASHQASKKLALAGNNGEQEPATFGLQPRRTKEAAPSLRADGADGNWLRGPAMNLFKDSC